MINEKLNVCIVRPNKYTYSETFIRNHIEFLPANVFSTYCDWWPEFDDDGRNFRKAFMQRNVFSILFSYASKLLPYFIFGRLPAMITGLPFKDDSLLQKSFKFYLKQNKIDVVLAEYGTTGVIIMDICRGMNIPLVVHFHGYDAHYKPTLHEMADKYQVMFKQAAAIICVSSFMRRALLNINSPADRTYIIQCGVDIASFNKGNPLLSDPILVSVGRFADKKAPHLTIMAFAKALKSVPNAKLIMVGDGTMLGSCKTLTDVMGLNNNIEFRGVQTPTQVSEVMQHARAFVLHSIVTPDGDSEGTPVAILEAASSGLPVISTLHAGIPDVIAQGVSGFLVKEKDVDAMAEYMVLLLTNKELAATMGNAGRKSVEKYFQLQQQLSKLMEVLSNSAHRDI